jgi:hypothetical protein
MKLRHLVAFAGLLLMALPAAAGTRIYDIDGDNSTQFPTDGTILRPNSVTGIAIIEQGPTLTALTAATTFIDIVGGTVTTTIPGTTVTVDVITEIGPTLGGGQGGTGSVDTTIDWGALNGWTQTGRLICTTFCPGGCPTGISSCVPFVGFEGTGPPAPLKASSFLTDTWTFTGDGTGGGFTSPSFETTNLGGGAVTANLLIRGILRPIVPALPLLGVAGLGAALVYLGTRAIRRKS